MQHFFLRRLLTAICFLFFLAVSHSLWAQYTPGNLVVVRVGDGTAPLSSSATPVSLLEYGRSAGSAVNTTALPTAISGANRQLTLSGSAGSEGALNLSADGRFLTLAGYDAPVSATSVATSSAYDRVVALIDNARTVNTMTVLPQSAAYNTNNIRSAITSDGTKIWTAGTATTTSRGGIRYTTLGATDGGIQVSSTITNTRVVSIYNGQLYVSSSTGSFTGVSGVGTGLPTTSGQTITLLAGSSNAYGFFFLDRDPAVAGVDLLYIADQSAGIVKYSFNGTAWTNRGTIAGTATGVTGFYNCVNNNVELYFTNGTAAGNTLIRTTDNAAYNTAISVGASTTLATAPANTVFRGLAFAPGTTLNAPTAYNVTGGGAYCGTTAIAVGLSGSETGMTYQLYNGATAVGSPVAGTGSALAFSGQTAAGTYTVIATNTLTTCSTSQAGSAVVTVNTPTTANAGPAQTITVGSSATLAANAPTIGMGSWSVTSGPSTALSQFSSITDPMALFTPAGGPGSYVLTWTISNAPCPASGSSVTITVMAAAQPDLSVSVAGPASATAGQSYTYTLLVSNAGTATADGIPVSFTLPAGVSYVIATGTNGFGATQVGSVVSFTDGTITPGGSATLTVSVTPTGTNTVTVSPGAAVVDPNNAIAESNEANNNSTQTVTTTILVPCPAITATLNGTVIICAGSSATLTAAVSGGTSPYSLTYSDGSSLSAISNYISGAAILVSPVASKTYTIVGLSDANACPGTGHGAGAQVTVTPTATVANAGPNQTIYFGRTASLSANAPTSGSGMWSVASGPTTGMSQFSNPADPMATFAPAGGPGTYVLTWTISNNPCPASSSNVTINVIIPMVNLSVSSNTASETNPTAITITATAQAPVVEDQSVNLAVTGTGITSGDYTLSSTTITIPSGQTAGSATFTVVDDNAVEGTETATLTISNPSANITLGNTIAQAITITDNDIAPGLSVSDVSMNEGNAGTTSFSFTVSLGTPAPAGGVTFDIATQDGTAMTGSDYTARSLTGQTIPAGSSTYVFDVLVNGDVVFEPNETFMVSVTNVTGAVVARGRATGTIINDDVQPLPDLTVAVSGPASATGGQPYAYTLVVSNGGTADATSIPVSFTLPAGINYNTASGTSGFTASQTSGVVSFTGGSLTQGSSATLTVTVSLNAAGTVTVSPGAAVVDPGNSIVESNEANNGSTQTVTTTVNAANQPPVAPMFTNQAGIVAVPFSYMVPAFTDPENQVLTYTITGVPAGLTANTTTRVISGTPTTPGSSTVTVVATDPQSATTAGTFTITINANQPPVAAAVSNQTATVGVTFSYTVPAFTDAEGQTLTYSATGVPTPLTFNPATRVISGTPSTTGISTITITATDPASNTASATFSLSVNAAPAVGIMRITEFMYNSPTTVNGTPGEFVELTNVGNAPVDMTGWSLDDNHRTPGQTSLSSFGTVNPGESVIITEASAADFRTFWYLPASVKVIGGRTTDGFGNGDEINLYDNTTPPGSSTTSTPVDRLTYPSSGTVITNGVSAWTTRGNLGANNISGWQLSVLNDAQNSYRSTVNNLGNPGGYYVPLNRVLVRESGSTLPGTTTVVEGGAADTYTVALNSPPAADVTVSINPGSQLTVNPATLTFTPVNYSTVQTVTVTAIDDAIYQGAPRSVTITQSATSSDAAYNGIAVNPVSVTIIDNDVAATAPPTIQVASTTTPYLNLPATGAGYVSGVIGDPTDPASTLGVSFTLADSDTPVASLTLTVSSSNTTVVPMASLVVTGTGSTRNLKITPAGVGYATVSVSVTDGSNSASYVINYAASAASISPGTTRFHTGTSDASTAVLVDANYVLVGDDENQVLRLYNRQNSGLPVAGFDFTSSLGLTDLSGGVPREVDLEASIRQNNRIFWIGSQSNKELGPARPNRDRVFATDISGTGAGTTLTYVGRYDYLKEDIINWDVTNGHGKGANYYGLQASADAAVNSKAPEGYNIEGAELAPDGTTAYIGFRAPQVLPANRTKALIVAVTNLTSLVNGQAQGAATFGAPIELDLGGRGIREIRKNANNEYVIIAGPAGDATGTAPADFRLYTWTGNAADAPVLRVSNPPLTSLNANGSFESIVEVPTPLTSTSQLQLLVDNGDAVYYNDGTAAKDLTQNNFKKFRSDVVTLGAPLNSAPMVATLIPPQSATVGQLFTYTIPANTFTDAETPNNLTLTVAGLPTSFSYSSGVISGTPSTTVGSPFSISVTATDPGSLSVSTMFALTIQPAPVVITALTLVASASPTTVLTTGTTTLSATVTGGTAPYSYTFSGPGTITPSGNTATVSNLMAGVQTFTVLARDATTPTSQTLSATVSVTVNAQPTGPATLTITSFSCLSTNGALSSVNFVVGYSDGSFSPALAPLFINGVTASGQLGTQYNFGFDANQSQLPIQDNATRSTYFVWNFRQACAGRVTPPTPTPPVAPALANQTATQNSFFSYVVPAFSGTAPISYSATGLPSGLSFDAPSRTISGTPSLTGVSTVVISASNAAGMSSGQFTITVSASAVTPTGPATLTITSFSCLSTNGALSSVNFVVGYSDGSFSPALAPLFINGVTASGQLGTQYSFGFDSNQSQLPIQDNASRSTYFVWNFRAACAGTVTPPTPTPPVAPALANQTATQNSFFSYVVPAFSGTAPISYSVTGLPSGLSFDAPSRTISGTPSLTSVSTIVVSASNAAGMSSGQFTITVSASATQPTGPATLTITSFSCLSTNGALSSVSFVVGYSDGSFSPALPPLFINGVTASGQLGTQYSFGFDANQSQLPIQDNASRSTYFVWNFRAGCTTRSSARVGAEPVAPLHISVLGNPVGEVIEVEVTGAEGHSLTLQLVDATGRAIEQRLINQATSREQQRFDVHQQPVGVLMLRATANQQSQTIRVLKTK